MPVLRIRTFSKVCRNSQDSSPERDQCRSSIRTTLRYNSVIPTLSLKVFLPAGKQISKKKNWVRLAEHGRIPTDVKYMNPRISFDGLTGGSVYVWNFLIARKHLMMMESA